ncbi:MAG: mannosyltransferase family protein [Planctomycetota bacterium]
MKKLPHLFDDQTPPAPLAAQQRGWLRGVLLVVLLVLVTRIVVWSGAYLGAAAVFCVRHQWEPPVAPHAGALIRRLRDSGALESQSPRELLKTSDEPEIRSARELLFNFAPLVQFDGLNYRSIITGGYQYQPPPADAAPYEWQQNIAFFPLYPLICRPLASLLTVEAALVAVAQACTFAAAIVLYLWIRRRIDEHTAFFTVAVTFCLPAACYYSFAYSESLTLLLVVTALWLMDRRRFGWAAVVCGLATATRPTALGIVPVFMLALWFNAGGDIKRQCGRLVAMTPVAAAGILGYGLYLTYRFGSPLVYLTNFKAGWVPDEARANWVEYLTLVPLWAQLKHFGWAIVGFPVGLIELTNPLTWNLPFCLFILFLSLAGLTRVPRGFRPLLLLGPFLFLHAYLASGGASRGIDPLARYLAVSVPALVVLAAWCVREWRPGARAALLVLMMLVQAAWAFRFGLREWCG